VTHSQRTRRRRHRSGARRKLLLAGLVLVSAIGIAGASLIGWVVTTAASAPPIGSLKERNVGANSEVFAADGTRLGFIQADELSLPVSGAQLPKVLEDATVAIEDERFYRHQGIDYEGLVRAAVKNFASRKTVQGGSTITMQLVRNLYTGERAREGLAGYQRKIREAKLAEELENEHPKEWILEKYLNTVPYGTVLGQTAIGAGAAARIYFGRPVRRLRLHEAALLAGLPQAPSLYSPFDNAGAAKRRRDQVLAKMGDLGMVTPAEAERAMQRPLGVKYSRYFRKQRESYVFDYVKQELIKEYGPKVALSGLKVHTTIDLDKQRDARDAIAEKMGDIGPSSAIVTVNPRNGHILAMASTGKYDKSKFNLAAQGHRQPGSSFKTMALMTALRQGVNPSTTSYTSVSPTHIDDPVCGPPFDIKTYGGTGGGRMDLRSATIRSDNSVYIQLAADLGPDKIVETAHDLGIRTKLNGFCGESLGGLKIGVSPLEMANAYATIADGGWRNRPTMITKIEFPDGHSELPRRWRVHRVKEFPDGVTYEATKILEANVQGGTGTHAAIGCPAAGKTGTTDRNTDAWFVGFTPRLATAVWVGYPNDRTEMNGLYFGRNVDGGTYPADIWGAYMTKVKGSFCGGFPLPKEPFVSSPFFGKYSRTGQPEGSPTPGASTPTPEPDAQQDTGGAYNPDLYEAPPQEQPDAQSPDNGNGNGDGTGGAAPGGTVVPDG
jgi:penicillin-binding protein 1A